MYMENAWILRLCWKLYALHNFHQHKLRPSTFLFTSFPFSPNRRREEFSLLNFDDGMWFSRSIRCQSALLVHHDDSFVDSSLHIPSAKLIEANYLILSTLRWSTSSSNNNDWNDVKMLLRCKQLTRNEITLDYALIKASKMLLRVMDLRQSAPN